MMNGIPNRDLKERSGIDADAEERDMREGELTGPAEQQIKPERQHGGHHQDVAEIEKVLWQHERQAGAGGG